MNKIKCYRWNGKKYYYHIEYPNQYNDLDGKVWRLDCDVWGDDEGTGFPYYDDMVLYIKEKIIY